MLSASGSQILKSESASQIDTEGLLFPNPQMTPFPKMQNQDSAFEEAEGYVNDLIERVWGNQPWTTTINTTTPDFMHLAAASSDKLEIDLKDLKTRSKSHYHPETPEM